MGLQVLPPWELANTTSPPLLSPLDFLFCVVDSWADVSSGPGECVHVLSFLLCEGFVAPGGVGKAHSGTPSLYPAPAPVGSCFSPFVLDWAGSPHPSCCGRAEGSTAGPAAPRAFPGPAHPPCLSGCVTGAAAGGAGPRGQIAQVSADRLCPVFLHMRCS